MLMCSCTKHILFVHCKFFYTYRPTLYNLLYTLCVFPLRSFLFCVIQIARLSGFGPSNTSWYCSMKNEKHSHLSYMMRGYLAYKKGICEQAPLHWDGPFPKAYS